MEVEIDMFMELATRREPDLRPEMLHSLIGHGFVVQSLGARMAQNAQIED